MSSYIRNRVFGGTYFFTISIAERKLDLLTRNIDHLKAAIKAEQKAVPFSMLALVVLLDHLHAIWRLPAGDANYSDRWRRIKCSFSRALPKNERISESRMKRGERGFWQRRFWEHTIRDENDLIDILTISTIIPLNIGMLRKLKIGHIQAFILM